MITDQCLSELVEHDIFCKKNNSYWLSPSFAKLMLDTLSYHTKSPEICSMLSVIRKMGRISDKKLREYVLAVETYIDLCQKEKLK
jgi:hypothetical protein